MLQLPPLSLYVHIPWCVQKCPYCDFNSHGLKGTIPEAEYIAHLLDDLTHDLKWVQNREISTIFIGGGTPSLLSVEGMHNLLSGIAQRALLSEDIEVTMEANPGTFERDKFIGFKQAGINRISIGVQSFQSDKLQGLGRIHGQREAITAGTFAKEIGLCSFNLDLMHGLPGQSLQDAMSDLSQAIEIAPPHLSWYQLTIEPNTLFHSKPPTLPEDETLWDIQEKGHKLLTDNGYVQYEISAYSRPKHQCRHNLNYWRFGDYLGIGCGAHGKITVQSQQKVFRTSKIKHPKGYMNLTKDYLHQQWDIESDELGFEYFMNRFRLIEACPKNEFEHYTGLSLANTNIRNALQPNIDRGLLSETNSHWHVTELGKRYLNSVLESFV